MKPLREDKAIILTAEEAALVREALCAASGVFAEAGRQGGPGLRALRDAALGVACDGRPLDQVHSRVNLAIDYIDFAVPARRNQ